MWITPDGVSHSNAHATPTECMTDRMVASLSHIATNEGKAAADAVFDGGFHLPTDDELLSLTPGLEDQWLPDQYLDGEFSTSAELTAYLTSLPIDWRLEAFYAVDDVLASMTEDTRWQRLFGWLRRR